MQRQDRKEIHKETQKYDDELRTNADIAKKKLVAVEKQEALLPHIKTKDRYISALSNGTVFENLFKSSSAQQFDAAALPLIEGKRETFGVRLTDSDLRVVLQKIATSDKDAEANKAILDWEKLDAQMLIAKRKIADEIRKENGGYRPIDFEEQLNNRLDEQFGDKVVEASEKILALPDDPVKAKELRQREKVKPGTPLDNSTLDFYLNLAKDDPAKAAELAREDGYEF